MRPTRMRMVFAAVLAAAALPLAACGSSSSEPSPGAASSQAVPMVTAVPAATAPVTGLGTVIEKPGSPPELCLGPVAESFVATVTAILDEAGINYLSVTGRAKAVASFAAKAARERDRSGQRTGVFHSARRRARSATSRRWYLRMVLATSFGLRL